MISLAYDKTHQIVDHSGFFRSTPAPLHHALRVQQVTLAPASRPLRNGRMPALLCMELRVHLDTDQLTASAMSRVGKYQDDRWIFTDETRIFCSTEPTRC